MNEISALLPLFEAQRPRLRAVAFRMLGSRTDADDAVQETWLRLSRCADTAVENLGAWLTTVVSHICLDMLRARKTRGDDIDHSKDEEPAVTSTPNPQEEDLLLADSVSAALLVVLQRLSPAERVAFVLHDMFDLNFEEIAPILDRTPEAARQLASRARRRVHGDDTAPSQNNSSQRELVSAFLTAAKGGDLQGLLAALDPNVVFRSDAAARKLGGPAELRGAAAVAEIFKGRAQAARPILIDGALGISVAPRGKQLLLMQLTFGENGITAIDAIADPASMADAQLEEL
jgi:RNA polymerase sigma factor (sigma-70 family)